MELSLGMIILIFIAVSAAVTFLIKRYLKADTYLLISLIKTQKPLAFFDRMSKHKRFLDIFSAIGLYMGFGAIAIDFVDGRKMGGVKRAALFAGSFLSLSGMLWAVDAFILTSGLSTSILIGPTFPLLLAVFGISGLAGFTLFSLFLQAGDIIAKYFIGIRSCPGVAPLIPGVQIPGVPITPPLHAWISLIIILIVHEGMHGILGRRLGFKIKSTGVILLGFLPIGAFVEPDEEQLKKAPAEKALPFLAAGPMANLSLMVIAGIILFASLAAITPLTEQLFPGVQGSIFSGVMVFDVLEETSF